LRLPQVKTGGVQSPLPGRAGQWQSAVRAAGFARACVLRRRGAHRPGAGPDRDPAGRRYVIAPMTCPQAAGACRRRWRGTGQIAIRPISGVLRRRAA